MQRATPLDTSMRVYVSGGARGCLHKADDTKEMQEVKVNFLKGETRENVERPQPYGFTGYPVQAEYKEGLIEKCAEHFSQFMGANRSLPVCASLDDRRYRLRNQQEGEVTLYDDQQQSIKIKRKEIQTRSQKRITIRLIKDEEQHKDDKSRDQQKAEDKPLSSMMLDKDTIEIIRTKDDGKLAAKKDEEDKKGTMRSRMFLTKGEQDKEKDIIIVETPSNSITIDEKAETITIISKKEFITKTEHVSITLNEEKQTIVAKIDKVSLTLDEIKKYTELKTENQLLRLDDIKQYAEWKTPTAAITVGKAGWVVAGDGVQGYAAARLGSITARGDVIVGRVATKVLVL